jgi:hypothetical protein
MSEINSIEPSKGSLMEWHKMANAANKHDIELLWKTAYPEDFFKTFEVGLTKAEGEESEARDDHILDMYSGRKNATQWYKCTAPKLASKMLAQGAVERSWQSFLPRGHAEYLQAPPQDVSDYKSLLQEDTQKEISCAAATVLAYIQQPRSISRLGKAICPSLICTSLAT